MKKFICDRSFMKTVLTIAIPLMLQQLISVSVNLVDNLMVGYLGDAAIGSVAAVNRFYMVASFATTGLASAGAVFIAQYSGARDEKHMKESFRTMLLSTGTVMLLFMLAGILLPRGILSYFTRDEAVILDGLDYIRIAVYSFVPAAITASIYQAMLAVGETKLPLRCSISAVIANTFLNYCLIFGHFGMPAMGVAGAAAATLIARLIEITLAVIALSRSSFGFKTDLAHLLEIEPSLVRKVLSKAAPLMLNEMMWSFGMATLFKFYSTRGSDVMSGYSICGTVGDLFFTLFSGMAAASTVLISTPLGADRLQEAKDNAYHLIGFSFLLSFLFAGMMLASTLAVPVLYRHVSDAARTAAIHFLEIQSCMYWIYTVTTQCYFILRSGGDMKHTLIMDSGFMWFINIPLVAAVTYGTGMGYIGLYICGQLTDLFKLAFAYHLVSKEHWVVNLTLNPQKSE